MTALGKILVFLVLVLSLVFNALVVNAYVARTNWKAEAEKSQKKAAEAAASANGMKQLLDDERASNEDRIRGLQAERDRLYNTGNVLQAEVLRLDEANKQQLAAAARLNGQIDVLQANITRLTKQVDDADKWRSEKEILINQLTSAQQASKVSENKALLDYAGEKQRNEVLAARLQQLADQLAEARRNPGGIVPIGPRPPILPDQFRGTVQRYDRDSGLVTMTPGLDAGVQKGALLSVSRLAGGGKYLGKIQILSADPKEAVGRFVAANPRNLGPDDYPRAGDDLKPDNQ